MLAKRIIPCLDVKDGRVVKGVNFLGLCDVSSPVKLAKFYSESGADELVFYDIIRSLFAAGADKVSINSEAVKNPNFIKEASNKFGSQAVIAAIDAKSNGDNSWEVVIAGGRKKTGLDAVSWAKTMEEFGAGEILLTSMDKDGMKTGYDIALTKAVSQAVTIPVIASGGVGTMEHFYEGFKDGYADAALAASVFHFQEMTIMEVKEYLKNKNIPVRI